MNQNKLELWEEFEKHIKKRELHLLLGPKTVQIEIKGGCNYLCVMCDRWKWNSINSEEKELSLDEIKYLIWDLSQNTNCKEIILSGGEPFLRRDIRDVILEARKSNLNVSIFTNGSLLNNEMNDFLIQWDVNINFSLDGSTAETHNKIRGSDSFNKVLESLTYFSEKKRKNIIGINFVIQKNNFNEILDLYKLIKEKGVNYIRYGIVHGQQNEALNVEQLGVVRTSIKELKKINDNKIDLFISDYILKDADLTSSLPAEKLFRKRPLNCYKVNNYSLIDPFGNVFPCTYAHFDNQDYENFKEKRKKYSLGNIRQLPFSKIWNSNKYAEFRCKVMPVNINATKDVCGQCEHYYEFKRLDDSRRAYLQTKKISDKVGYPDIYLYEFDEKIK